MAEEKDKQILPQSGVAVQCRNKTLVDAITNAVLQAVDTAANKNVALNEEDLLRCKNRFIEIFESTLHQNIAIGASCDSEKEPSDLESAVDSPECDGIDETSKKYLNEQLFPTIDDAIVKTTRKRRHIPRQCAQLMAKQCKFEHAMITKKVPKENSLKATERVLDDEKEKEVASKLEYMASTLKCLSREYPTMLDDAEKLSECLGLYDQMGSTNIEKAIYGNEALTSEPNQMNTESKTPLTANAVKSYRNMKKITKSKESISRKGYMLRGENIINDS